MTHGRQDLASGLRGLIARADVTRAEVSRRLEVSESTVSRWLGGRTAVTPETVRRIVAACDAGDDPAADGLEAMAQEIAAGSASRVVILRSGAATSQRRWGKLERDAEHVATFTTVIVPGLLQTEAYARGVFASGGQEGQQLERNVRGRLERQDAMHTSSTRCYTQILTEGALRWRFGSRDLMLEQVEHLVAVARSETEPRVRVGIIPWTTPVDLIPLTSFDLYDWSTVVVGSSFGTAFIDRPQDVAVYLEQFRRLSELALFGDDARQVFARIAEEYREG